MLEETATRLILGIAYYRLVEKLLMPFANNW